MSSVTLAVVSSHDALMLLLQLQNLRTVVLYVFKTDLNAGTTKGTLHIPGYQGVTPSCPGFSEQQLRVARVHVRSVDKSNIVENFRKDLKCLEQHAESGWIWRARATSSLQRLRVTKPTDLAAFGESMIEASQSRPFAVIRASVLVLAASHLTLRKKTCIADATRAARRWAVFAPHVLNSSNSPLELQNMSGSVLTAGCAASKRTANFASEFRPQLKMMSLPSVPRGQAASASRGSTLALPGRRSVLPPIEAGFGGARGASRQSVLDPPDGGLVRRVSVTPTAMEMSSDSISKTLSSLKLFKDLDPAVMQMIPEIVTSIVCQAGTVLFKQGDPPGSCYVVIGGAVGVFALSDEEMPPHPAQGTARLATETDFMQSFLPGQKTVDGFSRYHDDTNLGNRVSKLGPGSVVGELALMNDQPRLASAKCLEDTEVFVIRRHDFDNVLKEEMVKKGDEKLRFLMRHLPGMKEVPVPKPGGKPHAAYIFKHAKFPRGHTFLVQGKIAEPHFWAVYRGAVEFKRAEVLLLEKLGGGDCSMPQLRSRPLSALKKSGMKKSISAPRLHGIGRDGNVAVETTDSLIQISLHFSLCRTIQQHAAAESTAGQHIAEPCPQRTAWCSVMLAKDHFRDADRQQELGIVGLWRACMLEFPPLHSAENGQATLGQSLKLKQSFKIWSTSSSFWQTLTAVERFSSKSSWIITAGFMKLQQNPLDVPRSCRARRHRGSSVKRTGTTTTGSIERPVSDWAHSTSAALSLQEFFDYMHGLLNVIGIKQFKSVCEVLVKEENLRRALMAEGFDRKSSERLLEQATVANFYKEPMKEAALALLHSRADPNIADKSGTTALLHMCGKMEASFAKQLLVARCDPLRHNKDGHSPDWSPPVEGAAFEENSPEARQQLGEENRTLDLVKQMHQWSGTQVKQMIAKRADLNYKALNGWTPLTMAVFYDRKECAEALIRIQDPLRGLKLQMQGPAPRAASPTEISALMVPAFDSICRDVAFVTDFMQDRIDLDAVAANLHGPAPPDKHKEAAGSWNCFSPGEKKPRAAQGSPSSAGSTLPTTGNTSPGEQILEKELATQPSSVPSSNSKEAVDKWLKKHQGQFRGKASAFKKHVRSAEEACRQDVFCKPVHLYRFLSVPGRLTSDGSQECTHAAVRKRLASAVCILGSAAAFMLEHDGIPKIPLVWVPTLMCLVLLLHFAAPGSSFKVDGHRPRILHKFQEFGVHPDALHYSLFEKPNTVYCIFQADFDFNRLRTGYHQPSSLLYVGSTAVGAAKRHLNRLAVYRRLKRTEFVDAELSIRHWASHDNLFQFALVPLRSYENYQLAWVAEHELIAYSGKQL
eukprot:s2306_g1.t1